MEQVFGGVLGVLNDGAALTVRPDAIFSDFRSPVAALEDIKLDLEEADRAVGYLAAKYKARRSSGVVSGAMSMRSTRWSRGNRRGRHRAISLNLRAVGEYATYYGFDIDRQEERLFALNVLGLASSSSVAAKAVSMAQLVKIAQRLRRSVLWKELEQAAFVQVVKRVAPALSIRLTKAKLAQVVPVAGAVIGGGFNAYYTSEVCDVAYFLYRERFLAEKYGVDTIEQTVEPAAESDFGEGYEHAGC